MSLLIDAGSHPIAHRFLEDPDSMEFVHPYQLWFSEKSGLIQVVDPVSASELYSNYFCLSSWKSTPHISQLLHIIKEEVCLGTDASIIEIASNDGSFLAELKAAGYNNLQGIEPASDAVEASLRRAIPVIQDYLTVETAVSLSQQLGQYDCLIARHVMEHIADLDDFCEAIVLMLKPGATLLIEVPDFGYCLDTLDYSGLWEEHVNYFTYPVLKSQLARFGIEVVDYQNARFSGTAMILVCKFTGERIPYSATVVDDERKRAYAFRDNWPTFCQRLQDEVDDLKEANGSVPIWGAGCRTCALVNFSGVQGISYFVDDQSDKQGKLMPGSRLPIYPRQKLLDEGVKVCLLGVNYENEDKVIKKATQDGLEDVNFISIHPPSHRLFGFWKNMIGD
tara:strand:- start:317 stop:1495 length:1179 start_codon:yes stop_codon:yes gene_type:complete